MSKFVLTGASDRERKIAPYQVFNVTEVPAAGTGNNGDYAIHYGNTSDMFLKKVAGAWIPVAQSGGGRKYPIKFGYNGNATGGRFLECHHGCGSDASPFMPDAAVTIKTVTLAKDANFTVTLEFFKNGSTSLGTVAVSAASYKKQTVSWALADTDKLSCKVISGSIADASVIAWAYE